MYISRNTDNREVCPSVGKSLVAPGRAARQVHVVAFSSSPLNSTSPVSYSFGCLIHPSPVLHIVFATYPSIRLSSWSPFTLQSYIPFQPPLIRPSHSPICLPFLASYPHALPVLPYFNPPLFLSAYLHLINSHYSPVLFPTGRNTQNH